MTDTAVATPDPEHKAEPVDLRISHTPASRTWTLVWRPDDLVPVLTVVDGASNAGTWAIS